MITVWLYATLGSVQINDQSNQIVETVTPGAAWTRYSWVIYPTISRPLRVRSSGGAATFYVDDVSVCQLNDVSITVVPASAANSLEGTGYRVDGLDTLTQTIPAGALGATNGKIAFYYTPRHNAADVKKYGIAAPYLARFAGGANYIEVYWSNVNILTLAFNDGGGIHSTNYNAIGAIVAGTKYLIEIEYAPTNMTLSIDGVVQGTITTAIDFGATVPSTAHIGNAHVTGFNGDAVFS